MAENDYQAGLIQRLYARFPGCEILKNDASYRQGILDISIYYGPFWAMLEVKAHRRARSRPNQDYYIEKLNNMGFAAKIYPENEEEVLLALEEAFASRGATRLPVA